ncbi:MAG: GerAB/ArcD/ProY family transporter, partial [Clostridia bacterium]|nr:GerAB/ArcD/ProY family transporter [Clostridia bacterium]
MREKSGSINVAIMCSCAILSKYLVILPEYMVKYVGNSAWLDILAKCAIAIISLLFVLWLYKPFSPMGFAEIFSLAFGKTGKLILSYAYVIFFTLLNAFLLRLLVEALGTVMATTAPDEFFSLFILVAVFVAAYSGVRATTNLSCIIFPLVLITIFTVVIALFPHYRVSNITPVLGESGGKLLKGIFVKHFGFTETILLLFFAPMLGSYKEIKKSGIITFI